jgi:hypothetical protein
MTPASIDNRRREPAVPVEHYHGLALRIEQNGALGSASFPQRALAH